MAQVDEQEHALFADIFAGQYFINSREHLLGTDDLDKTVEFFGQKMSERALLLVTLGHVHEHLGQLIAYARANGVVPPWSAAESAAAGESSGTKY